MWWWKWCSCHFTSSEMEDWVGSRGRGRRIIIFACVPFANCHLIWWSTNYSDGKPLMFTFLLMTIINTKLIDWMSNTWMKWNEMKLKWYDISNVTIVVIVWYSLNRHINVIKFQKICAVVYLWCIYLAKFYFKASQYIRNRYQYENLNMLLVPSRVND